MPSLGAILKFAGVDGLDVYNAAHFTIEGNSYLAGRVESRGSELDSRTFFFEEINGVWPKIPGSPEFPLQDPFVTRIGSEIIFGGVETFQHPSLPYPSGLGYRTRFYRGDSLQSLEPFALGPDMMKDIRLLGLPDGNIFVLTRPQDHPIGGTGPGRIGFTTISSLDGLTSKNILEAKIILNQFKNDEWGGANELHLLENGLIGVLGHRAHKDKDPMGREIKHYEAITFKIEPLTGEVSPILVIASRGDFPTGPAKQSPELDNVIYATSLDRKLNRTADLYAGLGDALQGRITIPDPFII